MPPQNTLYGPLPAKARPTETFFYDSVKTQFGDEPVQYGYLMQAHTDGDIYVYFRKSNVLVAGGPVSAAGWPVIDFKTGGWIQGMIDGIRTLAVWRTITPASFRPTARCWQGGPRRTAADVHRPSPVGCRR